WRIASKYLSFNFEEEKLWERLAPVSIGGREILTFSPEDMFLILCVHGSKHLWQRQEWICCIAELLRARQDMNWDFIAEQAISLRAKRVLFLGLFLAGNLLKAPLPEEVLKSVRGDVPIKGLGDYVMKHLYRNNNDDGLIPALKRFCFNIKMREDVKDKVRYCYYRLAIPESDDWAAIPVKFYGVLFPLYSVFRPFRLIYKYARKPY
ncbi:MAG: nucleotidyltransferase family protein, partial [Candidatus Omnitrophica bacterium]|nr:nucleotidyltransferase family protein [Candidatus Omnitrophota bacterium]